MWRVEAPGASGAGHYGRHAERRARARPRLTSQLARRLPLSRLRVGLDELLLGIVSLVAARAAFGRSADFDFWWHLAVGRFIAAERALSVLDPFSLTAAGRDWTAHE
ncbi:MAG: hypothetical protein FJ035_08080 [Chloroflexi bacterium]|nr:hypothetical protein [Chloroflexota bacterium]